MTNHHLPYFLILCLLVSILKFSLVNGPAQLNIALIDPERHLATTFAENDSAQTELITNLKTKRANKFRNCKFVRNRSNRIMCHTDLMRNLQSTNGEFKMVLGTHEKLKTFRITMQKSQEIQ